LLDVVILALAISSLVSIGVIGAKSGARRVDLAFRRHSMFA
jgi:hypothetical protein